MTHAEAQELIPAYSASKLRGASLDELRTHLKDCEPCAELAAGIGDMVASILEGGPDLFTPHPDVRALRAYCDGSRVPGREGIARHLRGCASCSLVVSARTREQPSVVRRGLTRMWNTAGALKVGIAAVIFAVGVLVGLSFTMPWRQQPRSRDSKGIPVPSWSGPVDLHILPSPRRGQEAVERFTLRRGQPATILHLPQVIPKTGNPDEKFRLIVQDDSGVVVFDQTHTRSEMDRAFERWGVMPIFLPALSLPAGRYEVIVLRDATPRDQVAAIPFEIARED